MIFWSATWHSTFQRKILCRVSAQWTRLHGSIRPTFTVILLIEWQSKWMADKTHRSKIIKNLPSFFNAFLSPFNASTVFCCSSLFSVTTTINSHSTLFCFYPLGFLLPRAYFKKKIITDLYSAFKLEDTEVLDAAQEDYYWVWIDGFSSGVWKWECFRTVECQHEWMSEF